VRRGVEIAGGLALTLIALYAMWLALPWVQQSWLRNEASPNPGGLPWRWALKALVPLGFLLLALQGIAHALRHALGLPPARA
jgi:TRAP-type mannitol/chloroaromatic compound transport system permease small subunit